MPLVVIDWGTTPSSLAFRLAPNALVLQTHPGDEGLDLLARLVSTTDVRTLLFHICLSECGLVPFNRDAICAWARANDIAPFNGDAHDITKRRIQLTCRALGLATTDVTLEDTPPGTEVILKTNWNYGGCSEMRLQPSLRARLGISTGTPGIQRYDHYVIGRLDTLPPGLANDPLLTVERLVENRQDIYFRVYLCGTRVVVSVAHNPARIKKMAVGLRRRNVFATLQTLDRLKRPFSTVGSAALRVCKALNLDYAAADVVVDDDMTPHVIDINNTPWWGDEQQEGMLEHLRKGFD
jgi:hypothetical protein